MRIPPPHPTPCRDGNLQVCISLRSELSIGLAPGPGTHAPRTWVRTWATHRSRFASTLCEWRIVQALFPAMSLSKNASASSKCASVATKKGHEAPSKQQKLLLAEAYRTEQFFASNLPERVRVHKKTTHNRNRGGENVLPMHAHDVCTTICTNGTSKRRYGKVRLVQVPDAARESWPAANMNRQKA